MSLDPYQAPKSSLMLGTQPTHHSHKHPLWVGTAFAPLATPIAAAPLANFIEPGLYISFADAALLFPFIAIASIVWGYIGTIFIGLPTAMLLRRFGYLSTISLCSLSIPLGSAALITVGQFSARPSQIQRIPVDALVGAGIALTVALAFCLASGITIRSSRTPIATRIGST